MRPWNLDPEEWSNILLKSASPDAIGGGLKKGTSVPWATTLLNLTENMETLLDLGSGTGEHSAFLALDGRKTTLTDWSYENLQFSEKLFTAMGLGGRFLQLDITAPLPFKEGSFDTVFSCGVFEYFMDEEIRSILKESFRVSRKKVIIMTPNALAIAYRIGKWHLERTHRWYWGGERPMRTLKPHFDAVNRGRFCEFTVGAQHALNFLTMRGGKKIQRLLPRLGIKDHPNPVFLKQGYLLVSVGEKAQNNRSRIRE